MEIKIKIDTILIILGALLFAIMILRYIPFGLYFQCLVAKVNISLLALIFMRLRRVPLRIIVNSLIIAKIKGIELDYNFLELHYLAGGNVKNLVEGIIYSKSKNLNVDYKHLAKGELEQKNLKQLIDKFLENKNIYGDEYSFESLI